MFLVLLVVGCATVEKTFRDLGSGFKMIRIIPQKNNVAAEIYCDLNKLTRYKLKQIKSALNNYGLVYFRKQKLSSKSYFNFSKKFGTPANYPRLKGLNSKYPKITVVERKAYDRVSEKTNWDVYELK